MGYHHKHSHHGFTSAGVICIGISWIWYGTDLFIVLLTVGIVSFLIGACLHAKKHRENKHKHCEYVTVTTEAPIVYQQPYIVAQQPYSTGYPPQQPVYPQNTGYPQAGPVMYTQQPPAYVQTGYPAQHQ